MIEWIFWWLAIQLPLGIILGKVIKHHAKARVYEEWNAQKEDTV